MTDVGEFDAAIRTSGRPRDWRVFDIARRQHGVVAHRQLLAAGLKASAITRGIAAGRLHRLHEGVYAVGHPGVSREARWLAAVLACGPTALLSHRDAAALWGLLRPGSHAGTDVVTARRCRRRPGIVLHRSRRIHAEDHATRDGIPVTSVARTLLDLAETVRPWRLERAIEQAERLALFDLRSVDRLIARSRGRHGLKPFEAALRDHRPPLFTRSELERRFIGLCRRAGLPDPAVNIWIAGGEADMSWPERRLVVELDTTAHHGTKAAFERDRERDADLQLAGYRVLRVTDRRLQHAPAEVVRAVRALLDRV
jgi:uncharacterized protein DUF559/putative AbiEi antitoxin of type IV toxin-antitoxin system